MVAWKINKIPEVQENEQTNSNIYQYMRHILFFLQSFSNINVSLEVTFLHTVGDEIAIYVFLRNVNYEGVITSIEMQLENANYQLQQLDEQSTNNVLKQLADMTNDELDVIVKTEKIVTTPFMLDGYYYWADSLLSENNKGFDNYTILFKMLQKSDNSYISFQLMPTVMQGYELDVLQNLNMHLQQHIHNSNVHGINMYEPYAQPAYEAYYHYVEKRGQPVYQYNIIVGSMSGNGGFLANQVISYMKSQAYNAPELQKISIKSSQLEFGNENFPVYLCTLLQQQYRDRAIWGGNITPPNALLRFPYLVTAEEALMFFHLPYDDGKIVGVSGSNHKFSNELLSSVVTCSENIIFGKALSNEKVYIGAPPKLFSQHSLIVGMPGTGKTTFCINLLLQFQRKGIPFLAIEPTKTEYRAMIDVIPGLQIFTPGNNSVSPFIMNPFIPPKGIRIEKYIPTLYSAFKAAFSMPSPLDVTFLKAIRATYNRYGWRDYSKAGDAGVIPFGFHEFIMVFKEIIDNSDYSKEVKGNLRSGGVLRLSNLIEQNRNIFDTVHTIPIEDVLSKPTVIELNAIDDVEQKALIIAILLINVAVYTKNSQTEENDLVNTILIDEAHVLLNQRVCSVDGQSASQNYAVQLVENLIAEIRSYGTSIIIADQRPSAVGSPIVANTDMKIVFRITEKVEKDIICNSTDMDESMRQQLSQLEKGQAYVYYHKLKKPQVIVSPDIRFKEKIRIKVSDDEIREKNNYWIDKQFLLKPYRLCKNCNVSDGGCDFILRADAEYYCNFIWNKTSKDIVDARSLKKIIYGVPIVLRTILKKYSIKEQNVLINCIRIALQRKGAIEKGIVLDDDTIIKAMTNNKDSEVNM